MALVYNPTTGQYEVDPTSYAMSVDASDPAVPPASLPGGVEEADQTYRTSPGSASLTDIERLIRAFTSPQGIAGLAGAGLGYLDRPKPSGGGTTMAYPGAAQLERKMVQGPYGPLAQYTGVGGGTPDYTPFTAPKVEFPTVGSGLTPPSDSGMSMQAKVDYYKTLKSYGLPDDRIRRIAETLFGPQTDAAWSSLKNAVGSSPAESGIAAGASGAPERRALGAAPARRTSAPVTAPVTAPAAGDGSAEVDAGRGGIGYGAPANPAFFSQQPSFTRLSRSSSPSEISAAYDEFVASRGGDTEANRAEALQFLQSKGVSQSKINDAYSKFQKGETVAEITGLPKKDWEKEATFAARGTPGQETLGVWRDPTSGRGIAVRADNRGQPAIFTYLDENGVGLNSTAFSASSLYENADKLGIDLSNI